MPPATQYPLIWLRSAKLVDLQASFAPTGLVALHFVMGCLTAKVAIVKDCA